MDGMRMMDRKKPVGWSVKEVQGIGIVNPILFLPKEERERIIAKKVADARRMYEEGDPATNPPYVCPNGCDGSFRTHGTTTTLVGYFRTAPDPNHWTEQCSCETCGARFTKEWVPAKNSGKPWFVVCENGKRRRVYSGECQCCCPKSDDRIEVA